MSFSHIRVYIDSAHKTFVRYIFFQSGSGVFTFILVSSEDQVPPLASMIFCYRYCCLSYAFSHCFTVLDFGFN